MNKKIGFLVYVGRSGSTMLASLIDSCDDIDVLPETHFITKIIALGYKEIRFKDFNDVVNLIFSEKQFADLNIKRDDIFDNFNSSKFPYSKKDFILKLLEIICQKLCFNAPTLLIKTSLVSNMSVVNKYFPESFIIHLIRDVRGVHRSRLQTLKHYSRDNPGDLSIYCAYMWSRQTKVYSENPTTINVRYEDVLEDYHVQINILRKHIGLVESKISVSNGYRIGSSQMHLHKNVGYEINSKHANKWMKELSHPQISILTAISKSQLSKFNYNINGLNLDKSNILSVSKVVLLECIRLVELVFLRCCRKLINSLKHSH